jgi:hypothetical protein
VTGGVAGTGITTGGLLTVAAGETAGTLTVKATSTVDGTTFGTATVRVYASQGDVPTVNNVTVSPTTASVVKGGTQRFTATVTGTNNPAQTVTWSVTGNTNRGTGITTDGLLIVAAGENAAALTVKATSKLDNTQSDTAIVTVTSPAKDLVITGISASQAAQGQSGIMIGIFPAGTTPEQALSQTGIVAAADSNAGDVTSPTGSAPYTVTVSLRTMPGYTSRWTGSGVYDIYLVLGGSNYYRKQNVAFTSASTSVSATTFSTVPPPTSGPSGGSRWWDGTYTYGSYSVVLNGSTGSFKTGSTVTPISNISTETGGNVMYGSIDIGDWMYVRSNGTRFGIVINITTGEPGVYGGFNADGVNDIMNDITSAGPTFSPRPSTAGMQMPGGGWLSAKKQ